MTSQLKALSGASAMALLINAHLFVFSLPVWALQSLHELHRISQVLHVLTHGPSLMLHDVDLLQ